jgi:hypothetical protein
MSCGGQRPWVRGEIEDKRVDRKKKLSKEMDLLEFESGENLLALLDIDGQRVAEVAENGGIGQNGKNTIADEEMADAIF